MHCPQNWQGRDRLASQAARKAGADQREAVAAIAALQRRQPPDPAGVVALVRPTTPAGDHAAPGRLWVMWNDLDLSGMEK